MARNYRAAIFDTGLPLEDRFGQVADLTSNTENGTGDQSHPPVPEPEEPGMNQHLLPCEAISPADSTLTVICLD